LNNNRNFFLLFFATAAVVWILNGYLFIALIAPHPAVALAARQKGDDFFPAALTMADSALTCKPKTVPFQYLGNFENPFLLASEAFAPPVKKNKASASLTGIKLVLKGVLLKERPLAILEDETGKTYICGVGDTIQRDFVASIEADRVTLRGNGGPYTLTVKE
jgi:hypothetical protein